MAGNELGRTRWRKGVGRHDIYAFICCARGAAADSVMISHMFPDREGGRDLEYPHTCPLRLRISGRHR